MIQVINKDDKKDNLFIWISKDYELNKLKLVFGTIKDCTPYNFYSDNASIDSKLFDIDNIDTAIKYTFDYINIFFKLESSFSYNYISNITKDLINELSGDSCDYENLVIFKDTTNGYVTYINKREFAYYLDYYKIVDNTEVFLDKEIITDSILECKDDEILRYIKNKTTEIELKKKIDDLNSVYSLDKRIKI